MLAWQFRNIEIINRLELPRGPLVLLSRASSLVALSSLDRRPDAVYQLKGQEADRITACPTLSTKFSISLPSWCQPKANRAVGFRENFRNQLESGKFVVLATDVGAAVPFIADLLLQTETASSYHLGLQLYFFDSKVSDPIFIRRDIAVELIHGNEPFENLKNLYRSQSTAAVAGLEHAIEDCLSLYPTIDRSLTSMTDPDLHNQLFLDRLLRLQTLQIVSGKPIVFSHREQLESRIERALRERRLSQEQLRQLRDKTHELWRLLRRFGVHDRSLFFHHPIDSVRRQSLRKLLGFFLMLPVSAWGIVNHYIIYKSADWLRFWSGREQLNPNAVRILVWLPTYLIQYSLMDVCFGATVALFYLITLPLAGWCGLNLVENRDLPRFEWLTLKYCNQFRTLKNDLLNLRWEILEMLTYTGEPTEYGQQTQTLQH